VLGVLRQGGADSEEADRKDGDDQDLGDIDEEAGG
jgi:hypothetical protein